MSTMTKRITTNSVLAEGDVQPPGSDSERGFVLSIMSGQDPQEVGLATKDGDNVRRTWWFRLVGFAFNL